MPPGGARRCHGGLPRALDCRAPGANGLGDSVAAGGALEVLVLPKGNDASARPSELNGTGCVKVMCAGPRPAIPGSVGFFVDSSIRHSVSWYTGGSPIAIAIWCQLGCAGQIPVSNCAAPRTPCMSSVSILPVEREKKYQAPSRHSTWSLARKLR